MPKGSRIVSAATVAAFVALAAGVTAASAETVDFSGYLYDERTEVRFDVVHVKVLGQTGKELGDFSLAEGPVIELKGGGKFTFVVYTESGGGAWTAFYER